MAKQDTKNPCIGICRFGGTDTCRGCLRTKAEIRSWKAMSDTRKAEINRRVRPLMTQEGSGKKKHRKLDKLDRKIRKLEKRLESLRLERAGIADPPDSAYPAMLGSRAG